MSDDFPYVNDPASRCKDAAMALAVRNPQRLHWRSDRSDAPSAPRGCVRLPSTPTGR
jgi:hypothetical protein